jgi:predicted HTH domain antitoxin
MNKSIQINLRVARAIAADLDNLAKLQNMSRIDVARQILLEGISRYKQSLALRLYQEGKASRSRAASIAGISLWEMMDLVDEGGAPNPMTTREAIDEVRRLVKMHERAVVSPSSRPRLRART